MKLTLSEIQHIRARRLEKEERARQERKERAAWKKEQARMDKPGTGCHCCEKSERVVRKEGKWVRTSSSVLHGASLEGAMGYVTVSQVTSRGMGGEETTTVTNVRLCHDCLVHFDKFLRRLKGLRPGRK